MSNKIDWKRLSAVEMTSGIEVFYLSKLFRNNDLLHKKIIKHGLDEYRHSSIFYKYNKKFNKNLSTISSPHILINDAGLDKSPIDRLEKNIFKFCSYVYVGEYRALEFNNQATSIIKDKKILKDINIIENDELGHASGVMKYLEKFPKYKYIFYILIFKIRYFFQRFKNFKIIRKLQNNSGIFMAKIVFKVFPASLFNLKKNPIDLNTSIKNAKDI